MPGKKENESDRLLLFTIGNKSEKKMVILRSFQI